MIASAAGVGKSLLGQWYATHARVPTLYFSGDTDDVTMAERGAAMVTGYTQDYIRACDENAIGYFLDELDQATPHIAWEWDGDLGPKAIAETVDAFGLVWGEWPALIVFDVLISYAGGDHKDQLDFLLDCKSLATRTDAHVMVLHHTTGEWTDKTEAPPRRAIQNKLDQTPSTIVTLGRDESTWNVALVKSRTSKADPRAERPWRVHVDFDSMTIRQR